MAEPHPRLDVRFPMPNPTVPTLLERVVIRTTRNNWLDRDTPRIAPDHRGKSGTCSRPTPNPTRAPRPQGHS